MKILTGKLKGRSIVFKPNPHLRPTADKVRQALFNMLQGEIEGKNVLDLFSGTGALGLEALSQEAAFVTFVESDKMQLKKIRESLEAFGLADQARTVCADGIEAIKNLAQDGQFFDLIFIDPPYDEGLGQRALSALAISKILHEDTLIILESRKREDFPKVVGKLARIRENRYGDTKISFYKLAQNTP